LQISDERKKRVIHLYFNQHKIYAEIAQIERISPRDIHAIIKKEEGRRLQNKYQQQQEKELDDYFSVCRYCFEIFIISYISKILSCLAELTYILSILIALLKSSKPLLTLLFLTFEARL